MRNCTVPGFCVRHFGQVVMTSHATTSINPRREPTVSCVSSERVDASLLPAGAGKRGNELTTKTLCLAEQLTTAAKSVL